MGGDAREFDITVLGATGFTGRLIASYLSGHAPAATRIALAARDRAKLESVRAAEAADFELVDVDVEDAVAMRGVAERTRVLITTVGPYMHRGDAVVGACAEAGTDYLDLTGEPEFFDLTYLRHHARASETGARLVHACGFDSVPHDLGVQMTVESLPEDVPLEVRGLVYVHGTFSGGTAASALEIMARQRVARSVHDVRRRVEPAPGDRKVRIAQRNVGRDADTGSWVVPMPTIDPLVVALSARQLGRYGPDFTYSHCLASATPLGAAGAVAGAGALFVAAQVPAFRRAITRFRPPGSGPSPAQRERSRFAVRFFGEGGGSRVSVEVSGGDPGYTETSKMISEAALCLAHDDLPSTSGQVTTASAMGVALRSRLQSAGIRFEVTS